MIKNNLNWELVKTSLMSTLKISAMLYLILASAVSFGQILSYTGATIGLTEFIVDLPFYPIFIVLGMQMIILAMGTVMAIGSIMMITMPIFLPVIVMMGYSPIWFATMVLLNLEMAMTTPPFGLSLFVMKGVAPPDTTMADITKAAVPFLVCDLIVLLAILLYPQVALWLPGQSF